MEKRSIKNEKASLLGFGCMRLPTLEGNIDFDTTQKMIDYAYDNGVNYFDTAYVYHGGKSEEVTGRALKKYPRESFYIADKYPMFLAANESDSERIFNEQLARLGTDYIDFYLIHSLEAGTFDRMKTLKVYEFFRNEQKKGRIKYLGFSVHDTPEVIEQIVTEFEWDFAQIQLNYFDWSYQNAEKSYNILTERNIPVIVMEPVRGGFLSNPTERGAELIGALVPETSPSSFALRWVAQLDNVSVILSGMSNMAQLEENVKTFSSEMQFTAQEKDVVNEIVGLINDTKSIPCTTCRYCMECPSGVNIPGVFGIYNYYKVLHNGFRSGIEYNRAMPVAERAHNCTECGVCVPKCPQHIDIPASLKEADEVLKAL